MPLRARLAGEDVFAFDHEEVGWQALKANYRKYTLTMPCCGAGAVPKTSPRGLQFFAHVRRGDCSTASESEEHLLAKAAIARGAQQAGWNTSTEVAGIEPGGGEWIADVLATKGRLRVAFEVQWSRQDLDTFRHRQQRYARSGVRAAWFVRKAPEVEWGLPFSGSKELPIFELDLDPEDQIFTVLPWGVDLTHFAAEMLRGRVIWRPKEDDPLELRVVLDHDYYCWSCGAATTLIMAVGLFDADGRFLGHQSTASPQEIGPLLRHLPKGFLKEHGIAPIRERGTRSSGRFLGQGCWHCDAPMDPYWVMEASIETYAEDVVRDAVRIATIRAHEDAWAIVSPRWRYCG